MLKVNKKAVSPVYVTEMKAGDTFLYEGKVCMRIVFNSMLYVLNLETGKCLTNIHHDAKVTPVNCELNVLG